VVPWCVLPSSALREQSSPFFLSLFCRRLFRSWIRAMRSRSSHRQEWNGYRCSNRRFPGRALLLSDLYHQLDASRTFHLGRPSRFVSSAHFHPLCPSLSTHIRFFFLCFFYSSNHGKQHLSSRLVFLRSIPRLSDLRSLAQQSIHPLPLRGRPPTLPSRFLPQLDRIKSFGSDRRQLCRLHSLRFDSDS